MVNIFLVYILFNFQPEEEWNDYSEEVKDYTTLKMQNLTTECSSNYADNNEKDDEIEFEENDNGEMVPKKKNVGPWKVPEPEYIPPPIPKGNNFTINNK